MEMKHLLVKIEEEFNNICKKTMRNYILVLEYQGSNVSSDVFQEAKELKIKL